MAQTILSCLGLGLAATMATVGSTHLNADPSLMAAAGAAMGGIAGNYGTEFFEILSCPVAERLLEGRSEIDENHRVASALRLAQLRGLDAVLDRFDAVWPSDPDDAHRQGAERYSDDLRTFIRIETRRAAKADFAGASGADDDERRLRDAVLNALPDAFDSALAARRASSDDVALRESLHQLRAAVEQAVLMEIGLGIGIPKETAPSAFRASFDGSGFPDSWFDL